MKKILNLKTLNLNKGFTLVEMIISMGILVMLLSVLMNAFGSIVDVQLESKKASSVDQDGRYIFAKLAHDFQIMDKATDQIISPTTGELGVQKTTLQIKIGITTYTYSLNGTDLQISDGSTASNLNSIDTNISNLSFKRIGTGNINDTIQVTFTVASKTMLRGVPDTRDFQTTVGLQ